ncbi:MAG TPA: GNAT family N-acetyltransferase [Flavipsychrobacter sp.]
MTGVLREGDDKKARFYIENNGIRIAVLEYVYAGNDKFIIEHTEVDEQYEGKGFGKQLVEAAVNFARENDLSVIPLCPYANALFKRKPEEYGDVLFRK